MADIKSEIEEIVNRETKAWNDKDIDLLMTIWHHDMVFIWPPTSNSHDPIDWVSGMGRYNEKRWRKLWNKLFESHVLIHNKREIRKIVITEENDGAFAVVDVDTLWKDEKGNDFHWKGRACKIYTKINNEWKLISHTGFLDYSKNM